MFVCLRVCLSVSPSLLYLSEHKWLEYNTINWKYASRNVLNKGMGTEKEYDSPAYLAG